MAVKLPPRVYRPDLAKMIREVEVVGFGEFELVSGGQPSPIYFKFRMRPRGPLTADLVRQLALELLVPIARRNELKFGAVAGVPEAAKSFAAVLAEAFDVPLIQLLKEASESGEDLGILGCPEAFRGTVLVVEDAVTRATSSMRTITRLRRAGCQVTDVLVFVNRGQGGEEELAFAGITLHAVRKLSELLEFWRFEKLIPHDQYVKTVVYLATHQEQKEKP